MWFINVIRKSTRCQTPCCKAIHVQLAMIKSTLYAYNVSSQLISSVKVTLIESPKVRKGTQVKMVNPFLTIAWKSKAFHQLNHLQHSAAQDHQYKIILHARHKLRVLLIHSHTIKPSSCNINIWFISDL